MILKLTAAIGLLTAAAILASSENRTAPVFSALKKILRADAGDKKKDRPASPLKRAIAFVLVVIAAVIAAVG